MGLGKDVQSNGGIGSFCRGSKLEDGESGNTVNKDMVFVTPVEFVLFLV